MIVGKKRIYFTKHTQPKYPFSLNPQCSRQIVKPQLDSSTYHPQPLQYKTSKLRYKDLITILTHYNHKARLFLKVMLLKGRKVSSKYPLLV